jgi:outer membrane protein assembly factor BamB
LWKLSVSDAFGSFSIKGDKAYFLSMTNESEACYAVELKTGKPVWSRVLDKTITRSTGGTGPRSTPFADGERLYIYGTYLKLICLNAADGNVVWQRDVATEFNGQLNTRGINQYGSACSPIVEGDLVIVDGGGEGQTFLAFNKNNGEVVWKKETDQITHATPTPATIGGVRQAIFFTKSGLVALDVKSGEVLWRFALRSAQPACASPVVSGEIVYCSAGYGVGAAACRVTRDGGQFTARELWRTPNATMNHFSTPVVKDGYLYGLYGSMMQDSAPLKCIELATGKEMWSGPALGEGEVILVDGKLIVQGSRGQLVLVDPRPAAYKEICRAQVIGGRAWGFPAYSNGVLLHRTDREVAAVNLAE